MHVKVKKQQPAYIQLQESIRSRIKRGEMSSGMRLPPTSEMAEMFGTSVYTVQTALAGLVKEGLLIRSQKAGTFVAGEKPVITSVGLYYGKSFWSAPEMEYTCSLHQALERKLAERRIRCQLFVDSMFRKNPEELPEELVSAVKKRSIQGLIVPNMSRVGGAQFEALGIPFALHTDSDVASCVTTDSIQMLEHAVKYLKDSGCRTAGVISQYGRQMTWFYENYLRLLGEAGIETREEWILHNDIEAPSMELYGEMQFRRLWEQNEKPDGIFVYHDVNAKGVIAAVSKLGVDVPGQLKLVVHKNDEIEFNQPFPMAAVSISIDDVASALLDLILTDERQTRIVPYSLKYITAIVPAPVEMPA